MSNRLFLLDKNYVLKQVQEEMRVELQTKLIDLIKEHYYIQFNPLRLQDDQTLAIEAYQANNISFFDELYDTLAGFYRYEIGHNQLELLFDGRSHQEKYEEDWKAAFEDYIAGLATRKNFIIAGLELTVFYKPENRIELAQNRIQLCCYDHFGLKIYKHKGIQKYKAAASA